MGDSDHSIQDPLMPDDGVEETRSVLYSKRRKFIHLRPVTPAELLLVVLVSVTATMVVARFALAPTDRQCAKQLSVYSPALEAVAYVEYDFDNAFSSESIYRGPPTDEREAAWHALTAQHGIEIPADRLPSLNRSGVDELERVSDDVGAGYMAILEVFHQLHCLNTIRQYTWLQAGKYKIPPSKFNTSPTGRRMHVDHCIETVRLALMCFGDLTPVLVRRASGSAGSGVTRKADFNTHHKCRDFKKIQEWHANNWVVL